MGADTKMTMAIEISITEVRKRRLSFNATVRIVLSIGTKPGNDALRKVAYEYDIAIRDLLNHLETTENNL